MVLVFVTKAIQEYPEQLRTPLTDRAVHSYDVPSTQGGRTVESEHYSSCNGQQSLHCSWSTTCQACQTGDSSMLSIGALALYCV